MVIIFRYTAYKLLVISTGLYYLARGQMQKATFYAVLFLMEFNIKGFGGVYLFKTPANPLYRHSEWLFLHIR